MAGPELSLPDEAAVEDFYQSDILPLVDGINAKRKEAVGRFWTRALTALSLTLIAATVMFLSRDVIGLNPDDDWNALFYLVLIALSIGSGIARQPLFSFKESAKNEVVGRLMRLFPGLSFNAGACIDETLLTRSKVMPHFERYSGEDLVEGEVSGLKFATCEARLTVRVRTKRGSYDRTVFEGPLYHVESHKKFKGHTIITRDSGLFNWLQDLTSGSMERVELEDPEFERRYQVYSTDQIEARYLLTTSFMSRFLDFDGAIGSDGLLCAFFDKHLFIAARGSMSRFEIDSVFSPVDWRAQTHRFAQDLSLALQVVPELKLNQNIGM